MASLLVPFDKDVLTHLRLPFSFFLLPVFLFGVSQVQGIHSLHCLVALVAMHVFIYAGSHAYNSYMDQDEGAIGGLEHPPPATRKLYYASIWMDVAGLLLCLIAGWQLALLAAGYIGFSKAYSWNGIRLKKYPVAGWAAVAFFQGGYTYMLGNMAASASYQPALWFTHQQGMAMLMATCMIGAYYPLTQIYQHADDRKRGDITISALLGVRGTILFSAAMFALSGAVAGYYFLHFYTAQHLLVFGACLLPATAFFGYWVVGIWRDPAKANYKNAMLNTRLSAWCCVACFCVLGWMNNC